jgi:hypothetical protein
MSSRSAQRLKGHQRHRSEGRQPGNVGQGERAGSDVAENARQDGAHRLAPRFAATANTFARARWAFPARSAR